MQKLKSLAVGITLSLSLVAYTGCGSPIAHLSSEEQAPPTPPSDPNALPSVFLAGPDESALEIAAPNGKYILAHIQVLVRRKHEAQVQSRLWVQLFRDDEGVLSGGTVDQFGERVDELTTHISIPIGMRKKTARRGRLHQFIILGSHLTLNNRQAEFSPTASTARGAALAIDAKFASQTLDSRLNVAFLGKKSTQSWLIGADGQVRFIGSKRDKQGVETFVAIAYRNVEAFPGEKAVR